MALNFKYRIVKRPDGSEVKTPSIPITFSGNQKISNLALLDSGADISVVPKAIADWLGLDLTGERKTAFGIGGKVEAVDSKTNILIERGHEKYYLQIPVKVIMDQYDFPVLLGRLGFFDNFIISFDQSNEKVTLKKVIQR